MTWKELNEKYPESRDEMSVEREKEFLKDLYDAYETVGFANEFWSPYDLHDEDINYIGKPFKVVERCEADNEWDLESLPAWKIEFEDGHQMYAYPEEICFDDMIANGYIPKKDICNTNPMHLYIMDKVPSYSKGTRKSSKRKIKECLLNMEYDTEFIEDITDDFCEGFGVARDIIFELLKNEYWKNKI